MLIPRLARAAMVPVSRLAFRPEVHGREHVPRAGAAIFAVNHISALDSFLVPLVSPRPVTFLAKEEYFTRGGVTGHLLRTGMTAISAIPVPRGAHRAAQAALDSALTVLERGHAFGIHPEGTRSRDGRLYRGRTGVAWLAIASGAPVIPVGVIGTDRIQPIGAVLPRPGKAIVRFGRPMHFTAGTGTAARARRQATDDIMDAIAALSGQERAPGYNEVSTRD